jgi:hypothetical protein
MPTALNCGGQVLSIAKTRQVFKGSVGVNDSTSVSRRSRVSSGSIVSDYGLDDRAIEVLSPAEAKGFFLYNLCVRTGSGAHPASCTMGTGGPFPGGKSAAGA